MSTIQESIEVRVPLKTAYNQWTQFEEFPQFMEGVEEVKQIDDTHLHWRAEIGGKAEEWDAVITDQRPDERIAWKGTEGAPNSGEVSFQRVSDGATKVVAQVHVEPQSLPEKVGDALGMVKRRVRGDLERFKELIESQGFASGAWRGTVRDGAPVEAGRSRPVTHTGTGTRTSDFEPHS